VCSVLLGRGAVLLSLGWIAALLSLRGAILLLGGSSLLIASLWWVPALLLHRWIPSLLRRIPPLLLLLHGRVSPLLLGVCALRGAALRGVTGRPRRALAALSRRIAPCSRLCRGTPRLLRSVRGQRGRHLGLALAKQTHVLPSL